MESSPSRVRDLLPADRQTEGAQPSAHGLGLVTIRAFLLSVLLLAPLCAALGFAVLTAAALAYARPTWSGDLWVTIARSSFVTIYAAMGLGGGAAFGLMLAASRVVGVVESRLCRWLERLPATAFEQSVPAIPVAELRSRYQLAAERLYGGTVARLRLPAWIAKRIRAMFQLRLVEDLLAECGRTGTESVSFAQVRAWLVTSGVSLGFQPIRRQLRVARRLLLALLVLLALFPFALLFLLFLHGVDLFPAR